MFDPKHGKKAVAIHVSQGQDYDETCIVVSEYWWWAHREDRVIQECLSLQGLSEISLTVTIQIPILLFHVISRKQEHTNQMKPYPMAETWDCEAR